MLRAKPELIISAWQTGEPGQAWMIDLRGRYIGQSDGSGMGGFSQGDHPRRAWIYQSETAGQVLPELRRRGVLDRNLPHRAFALSAEEDHALTIALSVTVPMTPPDSPGGESPDRHLRLAYGMGQAEFHWSARARGLELDAVWQQIMALRGRAQGA